MSKNQNFRRSRVTITVGNEDTAEVTAADLLKQQELKKKQRQQAAAVKIGQLEVPEINDKESGSKRPPQNLPEVPSKKRMIRSDAPSLNFEPEDTSNTYLRSTTGDYSASGLAALRKNAISFGVATGAAESDVAPFTQTEMDGSIPDRVAIQMARQKRERLRELPGPPAAPDFIEVDRRSGREKNYMAEDPMEELDVFDSSKDHISVGGRSVRAQVQEALDQDSDSDDEVKRWELEQIRKGGAKQKVHSKPKEAPRSRTATITELDLEVLEAMPRFSSADIDSLLSGHLNKLSLSLETHRSQLQQLNEGTQTSQQRLAHNRAIITQNQGNSAFLDQMDDYVENLVETLSAVSPSVTEAEKKLEKARATRTSQLVQRVQQDIDDEAADIQMGLLYDPANPEGSEGPGVAEARAARRPARERRAQAKRLRRDKARATEEGWSSDEEDSLHIHKYNRDKMAIIAEVKTLLESKPQDCINVAVLKERFNNWKLRHGDLYGKAYISLSMPNVFEPLVRFALLDWEPLEDHLEEQAWFKVLFDYGIPESGELVDGDPDVNLIPTLVQKLVLPKLTIFVGQSWLPTSVTQTKRLQQLLDSLFDFGIPQASAEMKNLLTAIILALQSAVDSSDLPLYPSLRLADDPTQAFSRRQLWRTIKLFQNVVSWHQVLSLGRVQRLSLELLLNVKILPFLRKTQEVSLATDLVAGLVALVPPEWCRPLPAGLMLLHDLVRQLAGQAKEPRTRTELLRLLEALDDPKLAASLRNTWS